MQVFESVRSQPWLITEDYLRTILEITSREHTITAEVFDKIEIRREALAARKAGRVDDTKYTSKRAGVAVIEVTGPIVRYADLFSEVSGGTSTAHLALDFQSAMSDPSIQAIILAIDSPGGAATGIHELANMIYAARGQGKPIVAYAEGYAASAAYWIASAADEIVVDKTAMLGSIGVVFAVPDPTKKTAKEIEIVSTQSPKKRLDVTTDAGYSELQRLADETAAVFIGAVARNRGVSADAVTKDFGQGSLKIGKSAIRAGMADRLGSLESLIAELSGGGMAPADMCSCCSDGGCDCASLDQQGCQCDASCAECAALDCTGMMMTTKSRAMGSTAQEDMMATPNETALQTALNTANANLAKMETRMKEQAAAAQVKLEAAAKMEASAFISTLTAPNDLRFGKSEVDAFSKIYEAAKVASISLNPAVAEQATIQVTLLEAYVSAKSPVVSAGEKKRGKPDDSVTFSKADFEAAANDPLADRKLAVEIDSYRAKHPKATFEQAYAAIAAAVGAKTSGGVSFMSPLGASIEEID